MGVMCLSLSLYSVCCALCVMRRGCSAHIALRKTHVYDLNQFNSLLLTAWCSQTQPMYLSWHCIFILGTQRSAKKCFTECERDRVGARWWQPHAIEHLSSSEKFSWLAFVTKATSCRSGPHKRYEISGIFHYEWATRCYGIGSRWKLQGIGNWAGQVCMYESIGDKQMECIRANWIESKLNHQKQSNCIEEIA